MKFALILSFALLSSLSFAKDYSCAVAPNPDRGFDAPFKITVRGASVGSPIELSANGQNTVIGVVTSLVNVVKGAPSFDLILGFINEPDVSGVPASQIEKITAIEGFALSDDEKDVQIYQLFIGAKQVGGSFVSQGMGTACK